MAGNNGEGKRKTPRCGGALALLLILKIKEMALYDKSFLPLIFICKSTAFCGGGLSRLSAIFRMAVASCRDFWKVKGKN